MIGRKPMSASWLHAKVSKWRKADENKRVNREILFFAGVQVDPESLPLLAAAQKLACSVMSDTVTPAIRAW